MSPNLLNFASNNNFLFLHKSVRLISCTINTINSLSTTLALQAHESSAYNFMKLCQSIHLKDHLILG